jgi:hypothetical protein
MECPNCGDLMTIENSDTKPLVCPECESRSTRSMSGHAPGTCLVDYWPLDGEEIRRVILHLKELAAYSRDADFGGKLAFVVPDGQSLLWDQELDS